MEEQATYNVQINPIAFDLETIADASVIPHLPPVDPDSRLKDPEKIKENIKEKKKNRKGNWRFSHQPVEFAASDGSTASRRGTSF